MEYCAGRDLRSALGLTTAAGERLFGWCGRAGRGLWQSSVLGFLYLIDGVPVARN